MCTLSCIFSWRLWEEPLKQWLHRSCLLADVSCCSCFSIHFDEEVEPVEIQEGGLLPSLGNLLESNPWGWKSGFGWTLKYSNLDLDPTVLPHSVFWASGGHLAWKEEGGIKSTGMSSTKLSKQIQVYYNSAITKSNQIVLVTCSKYTTGIDRPYGEMLTQEPIPNSTVKNINIC